MPLLSQEKQQPLLSQQELQLSFGAGWAGSAAFFGAGAAAFAAGAAAAFAAGASAAFAAGTLAFAGVSAMLREHIPADLKKI